MGGGAAGGSWRHQQWSPSWPPSWILPRIFFVLFCFVFFVLIWPCMPGWAHLCGMWAWIGLFLAWFGIILSLIWHICELDLAHLWACFGLSCESDLGYQWACFSLFLSLTGHVSSHSGVGSFWACNLIFSILLCANILLSASLACSMFSVQLSK